MSHLGVGVMIHQLCGNEKSVNTLKAALGKKIKSLYLKSGALHIGFIDGTGIQMFDDGQSCCENRFMVCDDDLKPFIGAKLTGASIRDAQSKEIAEAEKKLKKEDPANTYVGEDHEIQFLIVETSKGSFTISNHNVHNGYYGGFSIVVSEERVNAKRR
jgi:hypothetical protein